MFNNFLNSFNQRPYEKQKTEFERYMVNHITGKHDKISNPFHIDCPITKNKVCYCKQSSEQLMDKKSREYHNSLASYLMDYYSGIQDDDYRKAFKNVQMNQERIKYTQDLNDLNEMVPKFQKKQELKKIQEEKERIEREKQEEERLQALQGLEQGYCYLCEKTHSFTFYEVIEKVKDSNSAMNAVPKPDPTLQPENISKMCYCIKRGKIPVHLRQLKEKLKQKRALKHMQLEKCIENQNYEMDSESDEEKLCVNQYCPQEKDKNLISCKSCERAWHTNCMDPPMNYELVKRFEWFCSECKLCIICWKSVNEDQLLMCDCCDRAYHMECRSPPMFQIPEGKWFCDDCVKCASCKNTLLTNENFNTRVQEKYAAQTIDHKIICDKCWKEYCPVCYKVVENDAEGSYVWCDDCSLWIHFKCEKLNQRQIQQVQQLSSYTCKNCKKIQDKKDAIKTLNEKLAADKTIGDVAVKLPEQQNNEFPALNSNTENIGSTNDINKKRTRQEYSKYIEEDSSSQGEDEENDDDEDFRA